MAARLPSRELYDQLLAAYREKPGNAAHAQQITGTSRTIAIKAWSVGWAPKLPWAIPIRDHLLHDQEEAALLRSRETEQRRRAADERREALRQQSIQALEEESKLDQNARKNALGLSIAAARLIQGAIPLAAKIQQALATDPKLANNIVLSMKALGAVGYFLKQSNEASHLSLEITRLRIGDALPPPEQDEADQDPVHIAQQLQALQRTVARAQRLEANNEEATKIIEGEIADEEQAQEDDYVTIQ